MIIFLIGDPDSYGDPMIHPPLFEIEKTPQGLNLKKLREDEMTGIILHLL